MQLRPRTVPATLTLDAGTRPPSSQPSQGPPAGSALHSEVRLPSRYQMIEELGRGGMGAVYRVFDEARGHEVALKVLYSFTAKDRLRLKKEFRALSDVVHPNLVDLHELVIDDQWCFFTMELVRGTDFARHVKGLNRSDGERWHARVRELCRQLAQALNALHEAGKVHRDVKPSNVLVTGAGRVVLLDFGLTSPISPLVVASDPDDLAGTPLYMAPEQLWGGAASLASDWYSFGVTLYEALTGTPPPRSEMFSKVRVSGEKISESRLFVSDALGQLIERLLDADPLARPEAPEILGILGASTRAEAVRPSTKPPLAPQFLVGREHSLELLHNRFGLSRDGVSVVRLFGASGIGKSSLMRSFFDDLRETPRILLLKSRCHPQEALAFNALDGFIDDLSKELANGLDISDGILSVHELGALSRVFPVLAKALSAERSEDAHRASDKEQRHVAFGALRQLLRHISKTWRIVVWIDDVQWADYDSGILIRELLHGALPPSLFLVLSYREEDEPLSPCLQALRDSPELWAETSAIQVGPLDATQSDELMRSLGGNEWLDDVSARAELVRSAAGSPFLLGELARYLATLPSDGALREVPPGLDLDAMLRLRTQGLSTDARAVLEVLAVAGAPLEPQTILAAANVDSTERGLLSNLERLSFLRTTDVRHYRVEFYHDRLREELMTELSEAVRARHHRAIANALLGCSSPNPLAAIDHFEACGDLESVRRYIVAAANNALKVLAFERAARLYRRAIELESEDVEAHELYRRLGSALGSAGRGQEAAAAFSSAARLVKPGARGTGDQARQLRQKAAEHFFQAGHFQEGTETMRVVLSEFGVKLPRSRQDALRKAIGLRLLSFVPKLREQSARRPANTFELARFDALWAANTRLAMVDYALCNYATARCMRDALKLGDPSRLSRALGMEAAFCSTLPLPMFQKRATSLLEAARALAKSAEATPYDSAFVLCVNAIVNFYQGRFGDTWRTADAATALLRQHLHGRTWEDAPWQMWSMIGLSLSGEIAELIQRVRDAREDAALRADRFVEQNISLGPPAIAWLAMDLPLEAAERADRALTWAPSAYTVQHYQHYVTSVDCDLYRGDASSAWRRTLETWAGHQREQFLAVTFVRDDLLRSRGRAALATAVEMKKSGAARTASGHTPGALLKVAGEAARKMTTRSAPSAQGFAALLLAGLANVEGKASASANHLLAASKAFDQAEMRLFAHVARYCGGVVGQTDGAAREAEAADRWMLAQGIQRPASMARCLAPGLL